MKSIQILNEIKIPSNEFKNAEHIEWIQSNNYLIDNIIKDIETIQPRFPDIKEEDVLEIIGEIKKEAVIDFIVTGINFKEIGEAQLNVIFFESSISKKAKSTHIGQLIKVKKLYIQLVEILQHKKKARDIDNPENIPIPNQVMKAMTGKQKGGLQDVRKNEDRIKALLKSLIKNNTSITREQKIEQFEQIERGDISFQMECYLGANFTLYEIVFIRAIEVIVSKMISAGEIENHFGLIYIPWHKIYEECGVAPRPEGGYERKASKKIRDVLKEGGNLRKTILVQNEFEQQIMDTSFILETQVRSIKVIKSEVEETQNIGVSLRLSSFLFFTPDHDKKLKKCTLMDNLGFIRFRKINKTQLGFSLFIWLEQYISQGEKTKLLGLNTIIVNLNLVKEYKKNPKRTKEDIERAFNDMIEKKTLITDFKKEIGAKGQEQYRFTNARYKSAPHKANPTKTRKVFVKEK